MKELHRKNYETKKMFKINGNNINNRNITTKQEKY